MAPPEAKNSPASEYRDLLREMIGTSRDCVHALTENRTVLDKCTAALEANNAELKRIIEFHRADKSWALRVTHELADIFVKVTEKRVALFAVLITAVVPYIGTLLYWYLDMQPTPPPTPPAVDTIHTAAPIVPPTGSTP